MTARERGYIFIVRWPADFDEHARTSALARALNLDPFAAREASRRATPVLAERTDPAAAAIGVQSLLALGIRALVTTHDELGSRIDPPRLRALRPARDAPEPMYQADVENQGTIGFKAADLRLLVRARTRVMLREVRSGDAGRLLSARIDPITHLPMPESSVIRGKSAKFTELLDLHLRDGTHYRCDASRFSFVDVLESLGLADIENVDRLAVRLTEQAPAAMVDTAFDHAAWLTGMVGEFMSVKASRGGTDRRGMLAFSIYSAVVSMVNRFERGRRAAAQNP
ncbi:hypothetical protein PHYC_03812 [Phycisphaerales bacterium]|nr:hypothetical protein PHYC_03812 [Phycisphaerales bacterium]